MTAARIPAAEWQAAKGRQTSEDRARMCVWLRIDPAHPQAWFAALPFVRMETDDGPRLAAVMPPATPFMFCDGYIPDAVATVSDAASVVLVPPKGAATLHRDSGAALLGTVADGPLFQDAAAYCRAWAVARLLFTERLRQSREQYHIDIHEDATGSAPGTLLIGDASRVQWPASVNFTAPDEATAKIINIAIWKAARLSRVAVSPQSRAFA